VPRLQGVVYCTWSTTSAENEATSAENEAVISACVENVNCALQTKTPFNPGPSVLPLSVQNINMKLYLVSSDETTGVRDTPMTGASIRNRLWLVLLFLDLGAGLEEPRDHFWAVLVEVLV